jgi:hypothetical protein
LALSVLLDRETLLHRRIIIGEIAYHAAIFERQAIGISEVDRLSPSMIDDVGDLYSLNAQLVALLGQRRRRTGLEREVIEAGGDAEPRLMLASYFAGTSGTPFGSRKAIS